MRVSGRGLVDAEEFVHPVVPGFFSGSRIEFPDAYLSGIEGNGQSFLEFLQLVVCLFRRLDGRLQLGRPEVHLLCQQSPLFLQFQLLFLPCADILGNGDDGGRLVLIVSQEGHGKQHRNLPAVPGQPFALEAYDFLSGRAASEQGIGFSVMPGRQDGFEGFADQLLALPAISANCLIVHFKNIAVQILNENGIRDTHKDLGEKLQSIVGDFCDIVARYFPLRKIEGEVIPGQPPFGHAAGTDGSAEKE